MILALESINASDIAQATTMIAGAIVAVVFMLQKVLKGMKETATESNVMTLMNEELKRLAGTNKVLGEELGKFQIEIITLNKQLNTLSIENQKLHNEVSALTQEVSRLQMLLEQKEK